MAWRARKKNSFFSVCVNQLGSKKLAPTPIIKKMRKMCENSEKMHIERKMQNCPFFAEKTMFSGLKKSNFFIKKMYKNSKISIFSDILYFPFIFGHFGQKKSAKMRRPFFFFTKALKIGGNAEKMRKKCSMRIIHYPQMFNTHSPVVFT